MARERKFSTSAKEIRDILISLLVLGVVFSYPEIFFNPIFFVYSLIALGIGFVGHELMHKFVAQHYGYWSEFRLWRQGLLLAIVFAVISGGRFIFAAPGAVIFSSRSMLHGVRKNEIGKIGIAGVVFNVIAVFVFMGLFVVFQNPVLRFAAVVNSWLAIFNLIPFPPLDGSKVFAWNWKIWIGIMAISVVSFAAASSA